MPISARPPKTFSLGVILIAGIDRNSGRSRSTEKEPPGSGVSKRPPSAMVGFFLEAGGVIDFNRPEVLPSLDTAPGSGNFEPMLAIPSPSARAAGTRCQLKIFG